MRMQTPIKRLTTLRYMERFSCIGPACEDHCCGGGWGVTMSKPVLAQIRKVLKPHPDQLKEFNDSIDLMPAPLRKRESFAILAKREDGTCGMLNQERLCTLYIRGGDAAQPEVCQTYPRSAVDARTHVQLSATMGCPEIARLALLQPDGTDFIQMEESAVRNMPQVVSLDQQKPNAFINILEHLRRRIHALLGRTEVPLASRLYIMLEVINQIRHLPVHSEEAARVIDATKDPEVVAGLHERFLQLLPTLPLDLRAVVAAAAPGLDRKDPPAFVAVSLPVLRSYLPPDAPPGTPLPIAEVEKEFHRRRQIVMGAFGERIDQYLQNMLRNMWLRDWAYHLTNLVLYVRGQMLVVALMRFLLISHPAAVAAAQDPAQGAAILDNLAVQLIYSFSRVLDNDTLAMRRFWPYVESHVSDLNAAVSLLAI